MPDVPFDAETVKDLKRRKEYKSLYIYCRAYAMAKNADALVELANCYYRGWGIEKDEKRSTALDYEAAKLGNIEGTYNLGIDYFQGIGIKQNYKKAYQLFKVAAYHGHVDAQYNLALCFYKGHGVKQDYEKAIEWFEEAAILGSDKAQCSLGICFWEGIGTSKDPIKATHWLNKAADQGNETAAKYVSRNVHKERIDDLFYVLKSQIDELSGERENFDEVDKIQLEQLIEALDALRQE